MSAAHAALGELASCQPFPSTARGFHDRAESALRRAGWQTRREVRVDGYQGRGGRSGFLDLVAAPKWVPKRSDHIRAWLERHKVKP